jgi:hypothetical protein
LVFSYWIDIPWFRTEGKLAAVLIKPSLGVSNWPVIYFINYTPTSSLAPFITAPSKAITPLWLFYIEHCYICPSSCIPDHCRWIKVKTEDMKWSGRRL